MTRFRLILTLLILLLVYGFVGSLDYLTELRLSCAQRYPDTFQGPLPDDRCAALIHNSR